MPFGLEPRVGLDLGTHKTVLWAGRKILFQEPTMLVVNAEKNRVLFHGTAAAQRLGKLSPGMSLLRPLRRGAIADYAATVFFLKKALSSSLRLRVVKPLLVASVPIQISSVETRAMSDAAREAGAGGILLVPCNLASLWSVSDAFNDPTGSLVVDFGGGITDISVIASNQTIGGRTIPMGGDDVAALALRVMEVSYGVRMGHSEAVGVMREVGVGYYTGEVIEKHRSEPDHKGAFRRVTISKQQIAEFLLQGIEPLFAGIIQTLEETPPELFEDIFRKGLILTGGASLLPGLRRRLQDRLNINVNRLPVPSLSVINGIGTSLPRIVKYREQFDQLSVV